MNAPEVISAAIDAVLQPTTRLVDVLLKVKALAYLLKEDQLKEWVALEIGGYEGAGKSVPVYRKVGVAPRVHLIHKFTGQQLPNQPMAVDYLDNELRAALSSKYIGNGVAEIEHMAIQSTDGNLELPHSINELVAKKAYHKDWHIHRGWQVLPTHQVVGVLTNIRSKIIELLFELRDLGDTIALVALKPQVHETVAKILHSIQVTEGGVLNISHGANAVQATNTGQEGTINVTTD
jgi:hypothetical protein